jgi:uncharacterized protein (DUF433 family)
MNKDNAQRALYYGGLIRKTPGVCGGSACIRRMRMPVWLLVEMRQLGATDAEIFQNYPTLTPEDLAAAWAYYDANRAEIDAEIAEENSEDD